MPVLPVPMRSAATLSAAPEVTIVSGPSRSRISRVSGVDTAEITFSSTADYSQYQIRVVPSADSPVTAGTLVETGTSGTGGVNRTIDVTGDELVTAGEPEGTKTVKIFVQSGGVWSS